MNRRPLGKSGLLVSEVGLGCEHLQGMEYGQIKAVVDAALDAGINIFDIFMSEPQVRSDLGKALRGRRDEVLLQGHIGAAWLNGQYCRTRDLEQCRLFFEDFLTRLETDTVDLGMLHFVDTEEDYASVFDSAVIDYALELKASGKIRALGMSSHNPYIARRAVETGLLDALLFSVNPAYDLLPETVDIDGLFRGETYLDDSLSGTDPARAALYRACEAQQVGITVMKGFGAGALLKEESSPFGVALSPVQCIHYALTRPAVASVLVGCRTPEEVAKAAAYEQASPEERDYSAILASTPKYSLRGKCMYCNHCLPCPVEIDVAQVNKYLDLVQNESGPATAAEHYRALKVHGSDCIQCGACEDRCPFGVPVRVRMQQAEELFGI